MRSFLLIHLLSIGTAFAACPNGCSGHGTCGVEDICTCYPGWGVGGKAGGDCSERFCPFEIAWVDGPTRDGYSHNYAECANKGTCNRQTGECECFAGFEGKGCGRQSCPDECSGHGTCEFMRDLKFGRTFHDYYDGSTYELSGLGTGAKILRDTFSWDKDRARACLCDGGWTGLKCDMRVCPHGTDIMDNIPSPEIPQKQTITLFDANEDNTNFYGQTFALQFTTKLNQTFTTQPIAWNANDMAFADEIKGALVRLPNKVIDDVSVVVDQTSGAAGVSIEIEFTGDFVQGPQHKLEVLAEKCDKGCNPLITGLGNLRSWHVTDLSTVKITTSGSHESYECGNRGKCNYVTGICECYHGFAGEACNIFFTGA